MISLTTLYAICFFIAGICIGSFSNVLIYRLPKNESINFPASHCQSCNTPLKWYHNIPVFSWLFLRGKCAFCKEKISFQYPLVELAGGCLMLLAWFYELDLVKGALLGICFILLLDLSIIDFRYTAVPDALLIPSVILSIFYSLWPDFSLIGLRDAAIFAFAFWFLRFIVSFCMKREAMGSGDIFIAAVIGAILNYKLGAMAIYIAALLTIPAYLIVRKKNYELPFVPFLAAGLLLTYIFKTEILKLMVKFL